MVGVCSVIVLVIGCLLCAVCGLSLCLVCCMFFVAVGCLLVVLRVVLRVRGSSFSVCRLLFVAGVSVGWLLCCLLFLGCCLLFVVCC